MRYPEFEAMIRPARLYPEFWRFLLGLLLVAFTYAGGTALLMVALFAVVGPMEYFGLLQRIARPTEPVPTLLLFATFAPMLLGPVIAAGVCHFRGPGTLVGPWSELRRGFLAVVAVTLPVYAVLLVIGLATGTVVDNLPWEAWLRYLPWAVPLILLQITAEETLFRGYIQQQLAARFAARWVWLVLPSLVFAAGHWNPEAGNTVWLIIAATFFFGFIAADLTARTGSLGAAMGLHFVNNLYGVLAISVSGGVTGLARWTTPFGLGENGEAVASIGLDLVMLFVLWRVLIRVLDR